MITIKLSKKCLNRRLEDFFIYLSIINLQLTILIYKRVKKLKSVSFYFSTFNAIMLIKVASHQTFNVASTLSFSWYDVSTWGNVKSMSNNVESMLCVSPLIWTKLGNVGTTLPFSTSSFTTLLNVEKTLW